MSCRGRVAVKYSHDRKIESGARRRVAAGRGAFQVQVADPTRAICANCVFPIRLVESSRVEDEDEEGQASKQGGVCVETGTTTFVCVPGKAW